MDLLVRTKEGVLPETQQVLEVGAALGVSPAQSPQHLPLGVLCNTTHTTSCTTLPMSQAIVSILPISYKAADKYMNT